MTIQKLALSACAAAMISLAPASAFAATEIFSTAIDTSGTPFTLGSFDTGLGTLTGVTLDFTVDASLQVEVLNFAYANATFATATSSTTATIDGAGGPISTAVSTTVNNGVLPNYSASFADFADAENFFPAANVSNSSSLAVGSSDFAAFESAGAGTVQYSFDTTPLDFTSSGMPTNTSGYEFFGSNGSITGGTLAVTYDYVASAVPEPAAWTMMLAGFGGIGFMLRGSRRKSAAVTL